MSHLTRYAFPLAVLTLVGCMQQTPPPAAPPDTRAADEAAIRVAIGEWGAAARAKDAAAFTSFYADDAALLLEASPDFTGRAAIGATIGGMMQDPNFALSFETSSIVVARSGDIAYERGSYELTLSDANQQPAAQKGNYVVVWRKQADGAWKVAVDSPTSDPAAAAQ
jgi:uncharacterized protein (TIGR02246 family)